MDYARPQRSDALAAHYVAGTLRGPARRRFEALLAGHPALRDAVQDWQARLLPLTVVLAPQAPPTRVWTAIERRLWPLPADAAAVPWWQRLAFWRGASGLGVAALLGLVVWLGNAPPQLPPVVVVLQATEGGGQGSNTMVASFNGDGSALVTRPLQPVALAADRALELWALPPQGAPRSLGLISAQGLTVISRQRLPAALLDRNQTAALAVSVEPPGGSPTGAPTGPVVYSGKLQL